MTKDEALKLALEALEEHHYGVAQIIIREALAQPERLAELGWQEIDCPICGGGARAFPKPEQEPVAWIERDMQCDDFDPDSVTCEKPTIAADGWEWVALYTTPPQRKPLTDEQIVAINDKHYNIAYRDFDADIAIARAIEAAHGIKENT